MQDTAGSAGPAVTVLGRAMRVSAGPGVSPASFDAQPSDINRVQLCAKQAFRVDARAFKISHALRLVLWADGSVSGWFRPASQAKVPALSHPWRQG